MRRKENGQKRYKGKRKAIFGDLEFKCRAADAIMRIRKSLLVQRAQGI